MLKTPPAFFTMYLIANIIFPKKNSNNCNLVLNQSSCNCSLSHENEFRNFQFYCCESHFLGEPPWKNFLKFNHSRLESCWRKFTIFFLFWFPAMCFLNTICMGILKHNSNYFFLNIPHQRDETWGGNFHFFLGRIILICHLSFLGIFHLGKLCPHPNPFSCWLDRLFQLSVLVAGLQMIV